MRRRRSSSTSVKTRSADPADNVLARLRSDDTLHVRGRTDIQREQIIRNRRAALAADLLPLEVDARHDAVMAARLRESGELAEIDVALCIRVMTSQGTRQHAGVGGENLAPD